MKNILKVFEIAELKPDTTKVFEGECAIDEVAKKGEGYINVMVEMFEYGYNNCYKNQKCASDYFNHLLDSNVCVPDDFVSFHR